MNLNWMPAIAISWPLTLRSGSISLSHISLECSLFRLDYIFYGLLCTALRFLFSALKRYKKETMRQCMSTISNSHGHTRSWIPSAFVSHPSCSCPSTSPFSLYPQYSPSLGTPHSTFTHFSCACGSLSAFGMAQTSTWSISVVSMKQASKP